MLASRLRSRRPAKTITVKAKTLTGGQHVEATVSGLSALTATYEQRAAVEVATDGGAVVVVTDVFYFEPLSDGTLPGIEEKHVLVDTGGQRYEAMVVKPMAMLKRLMVMCRKLR